MDIEQSRIDELIKRVTQIPISNSTFIQLLDIARELEKKEKQDKINSISYITGAVFQIQRDNPNMSELEIVAEYKRLNKIIEY